MKGEKDLIYEMGRPRKRQENSFDPEVLKEMLRHGPQMANAAPDPEVEKKMEAQSHQIETQAAELEQLRDQMRQNSEIMAGLLAELQSGRLSQEQAEEPVKKPASKTTTRRRKK